MITAKDFQSKITKRQIRRCKFAIRKNYLFGKLSAPCIFVNFDEKITEGTKDFLRKNGYDVTPMDLEGRKIRIGFFY